MNGGDERRGIKAKSIIHTYVQIVEWIRLESARETNGRQAIVQNLQGARNKKTR
jgi:hypothetical protein